jgi:hypothetical protein
MLMGFIPYLWGSDCPLLANVADVVAVGIPFELIPSEIKMMIMLNDIPWRIMIRERRRAS